MTNSKSTKRKMSQENQEIPNQSEEGRCTFYNAKKKRHCRQLLSPHIPYPFSLEPDFKPLYCGNHGSMYSTLIKDRKRTKFQHDAQSKSSDASSNSRKKGKRIPCPVDPSHYIYESNVDAHVKKCPMAVKANEEKSRGYYTENINAGGCGHFLFEFGKEPAMEKESTKRSVDAKDLVLRILGAYVKTFMKDRAEEFDNDEALISSLTFEDIYNAIECHDLYQKEEEGMNSMVSKHRVKIGGPKHMRQIGSIVGHVRRNNLLDSSIVLEMGAGRATTGFAVAGVCASTKKFHPSKSSNNDTLDRSGMVKLVVVEKGGSRSKADAAFRRIQEDTARAKNTDPESDVAKICVPSSSLLRDYFQPEYVDFHRIKCDLAHVSIPNAMKEVEKKSNSIPLCQQVSKSTTEQDRNILLIAKHLCGAGTDLALKSAEPIRDQVKGFVLATCCHGICVWNLYVGRDFLGNIMCVKDNDIFGESEFNYLRKWATGTVIGDPNKTSSSGADEVMQESGEEETKDQEHNILLDDDTNFQIGVSQIAKQLNLKCGPEGLGRACQRLIDFGRTQYMQKCLMTTQGGTKLFHYVDKSVTPQNAMLLGIN